MEMAMGNTEMYIMIRYETWTAGCKSDKETTEKPAVLVHAAWNSPSTTRIPGDSEVTAGSLISKMMKKIKSIPFRAIRIAKSHQVALRGKRSVKQRRGWSSKNLNSSHSGFPLGTHLEVIQMISLSMHGKPVLPMMMRKVRSNKGKMAAWNEFIESAVMVNPTSLKEDPAVKIPHHGRPCPWD